MSHRPIRAHVLCVLALTVALCALAPPAARAQYGGTPTITVNRPVVDPGDRVEVRIEGCPPPGSVVVITIGGQEVGSIVIGADGTGATTITVPDGLVGDVEVVGTACDGEPVTTVITVRPVDDDDGDDDGDDEIGLDDDPGDDDPGDDDDGGGGGQGSAGPGDDGSLPYTGSNTAVLVRLAVGFVALGATLVAFAARRDRRRERPAEAAP